MYVTKRLGVIGAEIDGLDLEKNDDAMYAQIDSLLMEHQVLFLEIKIFLMRVIKGWLQGLAL